MRIQPVQSYNVQDAFELRFSRLRLLLGTSQSLLVLRIRHLNRHRAHRPHAATLTMPNKLPPAPAEPLAPPLDSAPTWTTALPNPMHTTLDLFA